MTWHAKATGPYTNLSEEATDNAQEIANIMINDYGWTLEAACGAIGNMFYEVQLNPWRWQGDNILSHDRARDITRAEGGQSHGYGLIGWTPAKKYQFNNAHYPGEAEWAHGYDQESYPGYGPNWSDVPGLASDGAAQTKLLCEAMLRGNSNIYYQRSGHVSASTYITLTNVNTAASEFWWCVEYSASQSSIPTRQKYARQYYKWLKEHGWTPSGSTPPIWLISKKIWRL